MLVVPQIQMNFRIWNQKAQSTAVNLRGNPQNPCFTLTFTRVLSSLLLSNSCTTTVWAPAFCCYGYQLPRLSHELQLIVCGEGRALVFTRILFSSCGSICGLCPALSCISGKQQVRCRTGKKIIIILEAEFRRFLFGSGFSWFGFSFTVFYFVEISLKERC